MPTIDNNYFRLKTNHDKEKKKDGCERKEKWKMRKNFNHQKDMWKMTKRKRKMNNKIIKEKALETRFLLASVPRNLIHLCESSILEEKVKSKSANYRLQFVYFPPFFLFLFDQSFNPTIHLLLSFSLFFHFFLSIQTHASWSSFSTGNTAGSRCVFLRFFPASLSDSNLIQPSASSRWLPEEMDSDFWTSRLAAAKRQYMLQHHHQSSNLGFASLPFSFFFSF